MSEKPLDIRVLDTVPKMDMKGVEAELERLLRQFNTKILVLDDDPTGVQTVHSIPVYTGWDLLSMRNLFQEQTSMAFILTNSRGMTEEESVAAHQQIVTHAIKVSEEQQREFIIISRSDSTLRGHYPLETQVIRDVIEAQSSVVIDGEIIIPFFIEGGRYTLNDVHYVKEGNQLTPAGMTEFAKDKTFGYSSSNLRQWCEEKTGGAFDAESVTSISLEDIRSQKIEDIVAQLLRVENFNKVIVNAISYDDIKVFTVALLQALKEGKNFIYRTAAGFTKVIGGVSDRTLLTKNELIDPHNTNGGVVVIGSHVKKTSDQLEALAERGLPIELLEFNQHLVMDAGGLEPEVKRVGAKLEELIANGKTAVVFTRRDRFDLKTDNKEEQLKISITISDAVTSLIERLSVRPNFIIAKGGITSSDIGTKALKVKKATVMGQIKPGIPVWMTGEESKYPHMPYIIFPGNVGERETLAEIVELLL